MKKTLLLWTSMVAVMLYICSHTYAALADKNERRSAMEEEIWNLEEAYFTSLYKANYDAMLTLVHPQFLGWPDAAKQPMDKAGSARFMKQFSPSSTECPLKLERAGIRLQGEVALTQYILHVQRSGTAAAGKTSSSRITHTWVKAGASWQLLGGMSQDICSGSPTHAPQPEAETKP